MMKREEWKNAPVDSSRGPKRVEQDPIGKEDRNVLVSILACHKHLQALTRVDRVYVRNWVHGPKCTKG